MIHKTEKSFMLHKEEHLELVSSQSRREKQKRERGEMKMQKSNPKIQVNQFNLNCMHSHEYFLHPGGGDLMSDLMSKLSMRRKGISGVKNGDTGSSQGM